MVIDKIWFQTSGCIHCGEEDALYTYLYANLGV